ncbi:MAG: cation-translocating P-type ATPase [Bacteroidaceae bacterium]|nr:cation-translocating P-type ATPase [Bacteroidaceae bacterium]
MPKLKYKGLTDQQVKESRALHGSNVLTPAKKESLWKQYLEKFSDPLIIILLIAGLLSVGISFYEYQWLNEGSQVFFEPVGIFMAILVATGLAFYFEYKANKEFDVLNQVNDEEPVVVVRNGRITTIPRKDVVVDDIIIVHTGQEIPADAELLETVTLQVDESTLTGEPVCHKSADKKDFDSEATFPTNHLMRGTKVMEGHGIARVFAVGDATENGKVFEAVQIDNSVKTPLNEQLEKLGLLITNFSYIVAALIIVAKLVVYHDFAPLSWLIAVPVVTFFYLLIWRFPKWKRSTRIATIVAFFIIFIASVYWIHDIVPTRNDDDISALWAYTLQTIMIAVTLIVVAVPEGLPMAVTLSLAYSMRSMLKTNNLVRRMHACETMGATTVICTDKTGTLTKNQMQVYQVSFPGLSRNDGETGKSGLSDDDALSLLIAEGMAVNTIAQLDTSPDGTVDVLGSPTEGALLLWLREKGISYATLRESVALLGEIPFTTERKYMATWVQRSDGQQVLYVKGAPEIVLGLCSGVVAGMSREEIQDTLQQYQAQAMRTLGFAYQFVEEGEVVISNGVLRAPRLEFLGIAAISDPVREDVKDAVNDCLGAGIQVKVVTGDNARTAVEVARQIGLWTEDDDENQVITGPEFEALNEDELLNRVMDLKVIARARPMDKKRLVEALQRQNQVVAVTGDGTNDAPALKAAHVGLSMGNGTSVAKEASDITILDNSFSSIGRAVMWGRSLYRNIQRFLLFQLTVNVAACLIVLVGAFMGTESPLTVTQMLWVNLIMDSFGAMALASLPPDPKVMKDKPRSRMASILDKGMMQEILGVGLFFFAMLCVFLYIFQHADITCMADLLTVRPGAKDHLSAYEQTLLFSIFVWAHLWYMFNARAFRSGGSGLDLDFKGCRGFWIIFTIIVVGQFLIVEVFFEFFNCVPMLLKDWIIIILSTMPVMLVREVWHLIRR